MSWGTTLCTHASPLKGLVLEATVWGALTPSSEQLAKRLTPTHHHRPPCTKIRLLAQGGVSAARDRWLPPQGMGGGRNQRQVETKARCCFLLWVQRQLLRNPRTGFSLPPRLFMDPESRRWDPRSGSPSQEDPFRSRDERERRTRTEADPVRSLSTPNLHFLPPSGSTGPFQFTLI